MKIDKLELKLFLTVVFTLSMFIAYEGWNARTLMAQTFSIGFQNTAYIDDYMNNPDFNTFDIVQIDGHYYSSSSIGLPLVGALFLKISKYLFFMFDLRNISTPVLIYLIILITIVVPSGLTSVLIYRTIKKLKFNKTTAIWCAIIYSFGTMALLLGTRYRSHALASFLCFLAFYLTYFYIYKQDCKPYRIILVGFLSGFAFLVDMPVLIIVILSSLFILKKKNWYCYGYFVLGFLTAPLIVLSVDTLVEGNLMIAPTFYVLNNNPYWNADLAHPLVADGTVIQPIAAIIKSIYHFDMSQIRFIYDNVLIIVRNMIQLLFLPYRGLFAYSPILILGIIGLKKMYDRNTSLVWLILASLFAVILFTAGSPDWWCHAGNACRRFLPFLPFLCISIAYIYERVNKRLIVALMSVSIVISALTLQTYERIGGYPYGAAATTYKFTIYHFFDTIASPITGHYLPLFLISGPKSQLIEQILGTELAPFINVMILSTIIFIIWCPYKNLNPKFGRRMTFIVALLILFLIGYYGFQDKITNESRNMITNYYMEKPETQYDSSGIFFPITYQQMLGHRYQFTVPYIIKIDPNLEIKNQATTRWFQPQISIRDNGNLHNSVMNNVTVNIYSDKEKSYLLSFEIIKARAKHLSVSKDGVKLHDYSIETLPLRATLPLPLYEGHNVLRFEFFETNNNMLTFDDVKGVVATFRSISITDSYPDEN